MKMMKLGLLGGAAFAVMAGGAQADDLSTLKAEIEALNARVAQLETTPSAPTGYSLMTYNRQEASVIPGAKQDYRLTKGYGEKAGVIGVLPAADAPAVTTIEWSGYVYAIIANTSYEYTYDESSKTSVITRAQLRVTGKTDTAVGEVGVRIQLRAQQQGVEADGDHERGRFFANETWGWWAMTPELTLAGGYSGSLGNIGYGMDGACNCWWTDWYSSSGSSYRNGSFDGSYDPGDTAQIRLSWTSGPIGLAVALEEGDSRTVFGNGDSDDLAIAAQVTYSGDVISGEISGIIYDSESVANANNNGYQLGAGIGFALGSIANVSLAAAIGDEPRRREYWGVSGLIGFTLTDTVSAEVGANWKTWDGKFSGDTDLLEVLAGVYYNPVSQLTFGLEAELADTPGDLTTDSFTGDTLYTFDFVSIWRF
ncbi:MAG: hypothetical protein H7X89_15305 [Rhizobiales bacterium]|nr:hypothetical protein [Hyphomicrobiales bacterium]